MIITVTESGKTVNLEVREYFHFANVLQELGDSSTETMSQSAITNFLRGSKLLEIFDYTTNSADPEDPEDPEDSDSSEDPEDSGWVCLIQDQIPEVVPPVLDGVITSEALGMAIRTNKDLELKENLPLGWNCYILPEEDIILSSVSNSSFDESIGELGTTEIVLEAGKIQRVLKITTNLWLLFKE